MERAHRLSPFQQDRRTLRATIAAYLNYNDKTQLLQRFRNKQGLEVEGHQLLLFADYSAEVFKQCKAFSKVCTALYEKKIKFSLLYPAKLSLLSQCGRQMIFTDSGEAESILHTMDDEQNRATSPLQQRTPRAKQRISRRLLETPRRRQYRGKTSIN